MARFGFTYIEQYLSSFGVKVEIVNGEVPKSLQEELAQDMLSILTVFSAKLYGERSKEFRQKVKEKPGAMSLAGVTAVCNISGIQGGEEAACPISSPSSLLRSPLRPFPGLSPGLSPGLFLGLSPGT